MKRLKLDLSKHGIRRFWLLHAEKVVLVVAILLLGLFVYLGYQTPRYAKKTPGQVVETARRAGEYVNSPDSWNQIQNYRVADSTAHERIKQSTVDTTQYSSGVIIGSLVKTLGLRTDPGLRPVEELMARAGTFPVLFKSDAPPELRNLPLAAVADEATKDNNKKGEKSETAKKQEKADPFAPGKELTVLQRQELPGVRKTFSGALTSTAGTKVMDIVAVTGLIPYENQFAEYERVFVNALGYYPVRDRPIYQKIQIQRREEGANWVDITEQILFDAQQFSSSSKDNYVPDIIDPKYYCMAAPLGGDPITGAIPPIVLYDYRPFVGHPKVPSRQTVPSAVKRELALTEEKLEINRDPLAREKIKSPEEIAKERAEEEKREIDQMKGVGEYERFGQRVKPAAPYRLVRFFDLRPPKGKRVQYRVRLWMPDPNDPDVLKLLNSGTTADNQKKDAPTAGTGGLDGGSADQGQSQSNEEGQDGLEKDWDLAKAKFVAVEPRMLDMSVRERLARPVDDPDMPADREAYRAMMPTPWSNETELVLVGGDNFDLYAGTIEEPSAMRIEGVEIPRAEPRMKMVAAVLSPDFHTAVPGVKDVGRGDLINFTADKSHVLDPATFKVKLLEKAEIKTDAIVVDLMGGEKLSFKGKKTLDYTEPGEALVMDASGNFHLQNDIRDTKGFRHSLFRDDESNGYGKPKATEDDKKDKKDDGPPGR